MFAALVFVVEVFWASASQAQDRLTTALLSDPVETSTASLDKAYQHGLAAWYRVGKTTAKCDLSNPSGLSAAHRTLAFGTRVKVVHVKTGRSVVVRINDRGPFTRRHVIDLSREAARALDISGVAPVELYVVN
jgi:rare lipoprotein A